jgi:hypothetical protein
VFDEMRFVFDSPVSAFGFYATDLDFEDVFVRFANPTAHEFVIPRVGTNISSIFFGFIDTAGATSEVIVGDNGLLVTYDDVSFGRTLVPVPEPSSWLLLAFGLLGLLANRKVNRHDDERNRYSPRSASRCAMGRSVERSLFVWLLHARAGWMGSNAGRCGARCR